jgi:hypothetical protein
LGLVKGCLAVHLCFIKNKSTMKNIITILFWVALFTAFSFHKAIETDSVDKAPKTISAQNCDVQLQ